MPLCNIEMSAHGYVSGLIDKRWRELKIEFERATMYGEADRDLQAEIAALESAKRGLALGLADDGTGPHLVDTDRMFVSEYEVSREYGGPEEGGWWYDSYTFRKVEWVYPESMAMDLARAETESAKRVKKENGEQPRTSVIGTPDTVYRVERFPGEKETVARPMYC